MDDCCCCLLAFISSISLTSFLSFPFVSFIYHGDHGDLGTSGANVPTSQPNPMMMMMMSFTFPAEKIGETSLKHLLSCCLLDEIQEKIELMFISEWSIYTREGGRAGGRADERENIITCGGGGVLMIRNRVQFKRYLNSLRRRVTITHSVDAVDGMNQVVP